MAIFAIVHGHFRSTLDLFLVEGYELAYIYWRYTTHRFSYVSSIQRWYVDSTIINH